MKEDAKGKKNVEFLNKEFSKLIRILPGLFVYLFGTLGDVSQESTEFQKGIQAAASQLKQETKESPSSYFSKIGPYIKDPPSLRKTMELYSDEECKRLLDHIEEFVNANFYVSAYPNVEQRGEISVYPSREVLVEGIRRIVVDGFQGKLVRDYEDAEFVITKIVIDCNKFSKKRTRIIPGVLELRNVDPFVVVQLEIEDTREKLRPKKITVKGYSQIKIEDLNRRGTGDFNQRELDQAVKEAMKNALLFIKTLYRQANFIEATKHLTRPVFLVDRALFVVKGEKGDILFYSVVLPPDKANYFQIGDRVKVYTLKETRNKEGKKEIEEVIIEETEIISLYFTGDRDVRIMFFPSSKFKNPEEIKKLVGDGNIYVEKLDGKAGREEN